MVAVEPHCLKKAGYREEHIAAHVFLSNTHTVPFLYSGMAPEDHKTMTDHGELKLLTRV